MGLPVSTLGKVPIPVHALLVILGPTVKPELPMNVPIICALMGALAKVLGSTIILVCAPWDSMENAVKSKLRLVQTCLAEMVAVVPIHQIEFSAKLPHFQILWCGVCSKVDIGNKDANTRNILGDLYQQTHSEN